jgi:hypothetical protein
LPIADCRLPIADCRLPIADCRLPIADCRLPSLKLQRARIADLFAEALLPSLKLWQPKNVGELPIISVRFRSGTN